MFYDASSFNGNISTWDVSSVNDMYYAFLGVNIIHFLACERPGRRMNQLPGPGYNDITDVRTLICILQKFRGFLILTSVLHVHTQGDIGAPGNKGLSLLQPRFS